MTLRLISALVAMALATLPVVAADHDAFDGSWRLNAAKSTSTGPAWKSRTLTIKTTPDGMRNFHSAGVNADGQTLTGGYTAKFDGGEVPVTGNLTGADKMSLKRISPTVVEYTSKKGGKTINTGRSTVSADGKTLTITAKGTSPDGKPYTSTAVYDKQ